MVLEWEWVKFVHLRASYIIFRFWLFFGGPFFGVLLGFLEIFENVVDMRMYDFMGSFSEIYSFEWSLYDMCLACLVFSLTECHTFIVTGWLGESETIVNNIDTRWHHMLVVLCSNKCLPKQIQMWIAYVYGISPYRLFPRGRPLFKSLISTYWNREPALHSP